MYQTGIKHQAADALSRISTDGEDKTDLNDALPVLTIVLANRVKEAGEIDENYHIMSEALNKITQ